MSRTIRIAPHRQKFAKASAATLLVLHESRPPGQFRAADPVSECDAKKPQPRPWCVEIGTSSVSWGGTQSGSTSYMSSCSVIIRNGIDLSLLRHIRLRTCLPDTKITKPPTRAHAHAKQPRADADTESHRQDLIHPPSGQRQIGHGHIHAAGRGATALNKAPARGFGISWGSSAVVTGLRKQSL